jgi:hypothetical protein
LRYAISNIFFHQKKYILEIANLNIYSSQINQIQ